MSMASGAPSGCVFVLFNPCGLTGPKLALLLAWMKEKRVDVAILPETQSVLDPVDLLRSQPGAGALWPGARFFHCPGTGHTLGVTIILGPTCGDPEPVQFTTLDGGGRIVRIDLSVRGRGVCLVGVYGPAQREDRAVFFRSSLRPFLPSDGRPLLVGGDLNCVLDELDCIYPPGAAGPSVNTRLAGGLELEAVMQELQLHDVWREQHPTERAYTHWSASANSGGRLDRWLASTSFLDVFSVACHILPSSSIRSDHLPVTLEFSCNAPALPRGKGLQTFPLLLLNMPQACEELEGLIRAEVHAVLSAPAIAVVQRWDTAKEVWRLRSWDIFWRHQRRRISEATAAEHTADAARHALLQAQAGDDFGALLSDARRTASDVVAAWQRLACRSLGAAHILHHMYSDTSSFYFHAQVRAPRTPVDIMHLNRPGRLPGEDPGTVDLTDPSQFNQGLDYASNFYKSDSPFGLFREQADVSAADQDDLLRAMRRRLPLIDARLAEGLDGDGLLSKEDFLLAFRLSQRGSSPGYDGLPYEFYRAFQSALVPALILVFNTAFRDVASHSPLADLLLGVICLVPKPGQPKDELSGYRPITLLNCDVKLVMLIMSNRLQRPLDYLIDITQSAFLRGRDISDNVRYHLGLAARLQELGLPCWLLHSDLTKAYDSVNRGWLSKVMVAMGLRDQGIVRWSKILLSGSSSRVRVNGCLTAPFAVRSGLFQGSSLSCQEWVIVLQPFVAYLNQLQAAGSLASFLLPSGRRAPAACAFADDTKLPVLDPDGEGGEVIKPAFDKAARAGNPKQSIPKTVLLHLNGVIPPTMDAAVQEYHASTGYRLQQISKPHRLLGVPFCSDHAACQQGAFGSMPGAMRAAAAVWASVGPNLLGRVHVAWQCIASKFVFQCNFLAPPVVLRLAMQRAVNTFVSSSERREEETPFGGKLFPRFEVAVLPTVSGGLGLPDLHAHASAMRAKLVWLLFRHSAHPWQDLFRHETAGVAGGGGGGSRGYHWVVTNPRSGGQLAAIHTPLLREAIEAFLKLGVQRIVEPEEQSFHSIMLELTFQPTTLAIIEVASVAARGWVRLRDVRAAYAGRALLGGPEGQDLDMVVSRLPAAWRRAVTALHPGISEWQALFLQGEEDCIFLGPDPMTQQVGLWRLWPSGRLHALSADHPVPRAPARPALVSLRPKDQEHWLRADYALAEDLLEREGPDPDQIMEPWLVGIWDEMELDPEAWGIITPDVVKIPLLVMCVRDARRCFGHSNTLDRQSASSSSVVRGYRQAGAAWPQLWAVTPDLLAVDQPRTAAGNLRLASCGIDGLEESWRRERARLGEAVPPEEIARDPAWLELGTPIPRPSPEDRRAARGVDEMLRDGFRDTWRRLDDPTIHRPFRITCWRLLHGCLGCNAFLAHVRSHQHGTRAEEGRTCLCTAPECLAAGSVEDLSHAFLLCPHVAPVIDWLLATWLHLSGVAAPRTARVLLADDPAGWPDCPQDAWAYQLWTRLRVATLGAIWQVRCARDEGPDGVSFASRAVALAVQSLAGAIKRDWLRTQSDVRELDDGAFCHDWWRGLDCRMSIGRFERTWARLPLLCRLVHEDEGTSLVIRFGPGMPVPWPGGPGVSADEALISADVPGVVSEGDVPAAALQVPTIPAPAFLGPPVAPAPPPPPPEPPDSPATQGDDGDLCTICLRSLERGEIVVTVCSHRFHRPCLRRWLVGFRKDTCPSCRGALEANAAE